MDLVRDLLDQKIVDRNGREMGRVDGIVLDRRDGATPRVAAIELGAAVVGHRVHPFIGRLAAGLEHAFAIDAGRPVRIAWRDVLDVHDHVKVDLVFGQTAASTVEHLLRRWIGSLPRSS